MSQQDMSQRNCHACGQQLGFGTMVKAVDKEWHQGCFNCVECRQPVQGEFRVRGDPSSGGRVELLCCPCDERIRQAALNSAPVCNGCGNRIVSGQVLAIAGNNFHPNCFVCSQCRAPIQGGACQVNGQFTCQPCATRMQQNAGAQNYNNNNAQNAPRGAGGPGAAGAAAVPAGGGGPASEYCAGCGNGIVSGRTLRTGGKVYHADCFKCTRCASNIATGAAVNLLEGLPYCSPCVDELTRQRLAQQQNGGGSGVPAGGHNHGGPGAGAGGAGAPRSAPGGGYPAPGGAAGGAGPGSLVCSDCKQVIVGEYMTTDGKHYCRNCSSRHQMGALQDTPCTTCHKPLGIGTYKRAQDSFYHPACFVCHNCKGVIDRDFKKHTKNPDPNIYCVPCFDDLFAKKCEKCKKPITGEAVRLEKKNVYEESYEIPGNNEPVVQPPALPPRPEAGGAGGGAGHGGAGGHGASGGAGGAAGAANSGPSGPKMKNSHWTMKGSKWIRTDGKVSATGDFGNVTKTSHAVRCQVTSGAAASTMGGGIASTAGPRAVNSADSGPNSGYSGGAAGSGAGGYGSGSGAGAGTGASAGASAGAGAGGAGGAAGNRMVTETTSSTGTRQRIETIEVFYHVHCFTCVKCHREFGGGKFYMTEDDQPHCGECANQL